MQIIFALIVAALVIGGTGMYARNRVDRIAASGTPGAAKAAKGVQKQARVLGDRAAAVWAEAHSADWLERRRLSRQRAQARRDMTGRAARTAAAGTGSAIRRTARGTRAASRAAVRRLVLPGGTWKPQDIRPAQQNGDSRVTTAAVTPTRVAPPTASITPNGRTPSPMTTPTAATGAAGADLFTAIQATTSRILSGNLRAKQGGITSLGDGLDYISQALGSMARALSEPGQEYPAAIWEPISKAAAHVKAAASACSESTSAVNALAGMQVGELADSATRAPHNSQLNSA